MSAGGGSWSAGSTEDITDEALLQRFLFEPKRVPPRKLLNDLTGLQAATCFYCGTTLRDKHIDHFIPWSHSLDEGIDNLVLACRSCNLSKSAHRAAGLHVEMVVSAVRSDQPSCARVDRVRTRWEKDRGRTLGLARSTYFSLPAGTKLWRAKSGFSEISGGAA